MKNLPEFKALIDRYESITIDEINKYWNISYEDKAKPLTGFGSIHTCTLCKPCLDLSLYPDCNMCVWKVLTGGKCMWGSNDDTYTSIEDSQSPTDLLAAFRARAAYMRQVLKDGGIE